MIANCYLVSMICVNSKKEGPQKRLPSITFYASMKTQFMIDHLSAFSKKVVWLKPLFFITTAAAFIVFGYVVLIEEGADKDVYIIPSIVGMLWSLVCSLLLSVFPYVPPKPDKQQRFSKRLKIRLARGGYHIGSLMFCVLSASVVWLTLKLINIWRADF
jgi:hypothetical protein